MFMIQRDTGPINSYLGALWTVPSSRAAMRSTSVSTAAYMARAVLLPLWLVMTERKAAFLTPDKHL